MKLRYLIPALAALFACAQANAGAGEVAKAALCAAAPMKACDVLSIRNHGNMSKVAIMKQLQRHCGGSMNPSQAKQLFDMGYATDKKRCQAALNLYSAHQRVFNQ